MRLLLLLVVWLLLLLWLLVVLVLEGLYPQVLLRQRQLVPQTLGQLQLLCMSRLQLLCVLHCCAAQCACSRLLPLPQPGHPPPEWQSELAGCPWRQAQMSLRQLQLLKGLQQQGAQL